MEKTTKDLVSMENFERWQAGKPPIPEPAPTIPEPDPPQVKDRLRVENLKVDNIASLLSARRKPVRNKSGVISVGFDVVLKMKDEMKDGKKIPGKTISGWMDGKDFHDFRHGLFKKGEVSLDKISI